MHVSFVILNCNGKEFLARCIPSVMVAIESYNKPCEVIVVDNASADASIDYIKLNFLQIRILALKENFGFAKAMNIGIKKATHPIVIGLNNDIIVEEDFIAPLVGHLSNNGEIFAVAAKMLLWEGESLNFGRAIGSFRFGVFHRKLVDKPAPANTLYACGGGFAVDKNKFLELGGFDEDMDVYWEDADLCYRGWKRGWKTVYEPRSIIYHKFHGTYSHKYGGNGIQKKSGENYFLFVIKNIHDKIFFYQQLLFLPFLTLISVFIGKPHFAKGLLLSLRRWPLFLKKRRMEKQKAVLSDRDIFRISGQ